MLPTPSTSHVPYGRVYEPAEDSFLMIDTLAAASETAFLQDRFGGGGSSSTSAGTSAGTAAGDSSAPPPPPPPPLVVEIGSGSGVVLAFVAAQAPHLFGRSCHVLPMAVDVNAFACRATGETVRLAVSEGEAEKKKKKKEEKEEEEEVEEEEEEDRTLKNGHVSFLGAVRADLVSALRPGQVDVLLFNPPYVPTPDLPVLPGEVREDEDEGQDDSSSSAAQDVFARDSHLLALAYAGGRDGMETTDRLLAALPAVLAPRGCAYVLLCAQNRPEEVKARIRAWEIDGGDSSWQAETVGSSGKQAGWEKLQIVRIWRD